MNFKKHLKIETDNFWYDVFEGGYITPHGTMENKEDADKIAAAINLIDHWFNELQRQNKIEFY